MCFHQPKVIARRGVDRIENRQQHRGNDPQSCTDQQRQLARLFRATAVRCCFPTATAPNSLLQQVQVEFCISEKGVAILPTRCHCRCI